MGIPERASACCIRIEGKFDANLMRLTPEVERWAGSG
jgi:hypothetical protein